MSLSLLNLNGHKQLDNFVYGIPKPHRLTLDYAFVSAYAEYLKEAPYLSWEDWWEWRAVSQHTMGSPVSRSLQSFIREKDFALFQKLRAGNMYLKPTDAYWRSVTSVYNLVYTKYVEPYERWDAITEAIDKQQGDMRSDEYESVIALIKLHGIEIANCQRVLQRADLLGNTAAKNFVEYQELYREISSLSAEDGRTMYKHFLKFKVEQGLQEGFITIHERQALLHLLGSRE